MSLPTAMQSSSNTFPIISAQTSEPHNWPFHPPNADLASFTVRSAPAGEHYVFGTRPPQQRLAVCYDALRRSRVNAGSLFGQWGPPRHCDVLLLAALVVALQCAVQSGETDTTDTNCPDA
jgi:hypothetical protein